MAPDASFASKRPSLRLTSKRRHYSTPAPPPPPSSAALFRVLCPTSRVGGLIGRGGAVIKKFRNDTKAKILVDSPVPGCLDRLILISHDDDDDDAANKNDDDSTTPSHKALLLVFDRIFKADEGNTIPPHDEAVMFRLLISPSQVQCVLGTGGHILQRISRHSGANLRVFHKEQLPNCASPSDILLQMIGNFSAVRRALVFVSGCLHGNLGADITCSATTGSSIMQLHGSGMQSFGSCSSIALEEEIVIKLLCQVDKVSRLVGPGGSILRALQSETGASIRILDALYASDESVIVMSAREKPEQRYSPAQDAAVLVQGRIAEIGFVPGAAVVARMLVSSKQIGCLWDKEGIVIAELRRVTGASIHVFPKEPSWFQNDEVVQVIGSLQSVQDALLQITSRLREAVFHVNLQFSNSSVPPYLTLPERLPHFLRHRHNSTGSQSPLPHSLDRDAYPGPHFSHSTERLRPTYLDRVSYHYDNEKVVHGRSTNKLPSPGNMSSQAVGSRSSGEATDFEEGLASKNDPADRTRASPASSITVEVVIPRSLLGYVYGENNTNLVHIRQMSGADVVVHDPRPGATEGVAIVSGNLDQIHTAQSLIHAFILAEKHSRDKAW